MNTKYIFQKSNKFIFQIFKNKQRNYSKSDSSEKTSTGTSSSSTNTNLPFWIERWETNQIGFHRPALSHLCKSHLIPKLNASKEQNTVVFTLCGKTVDMLGVLETGHRVIGIDGSSTGVEGFFKENNISYEIEKDQQDHFQIYKGIDRSVTIYCGDFFTFNKPIKPVDYIWDRGGLVAINPSDREKYRDCLLRMMTRGHTELFLVAMNYTDPKFTAPPHIVNDEDVKHLFGSNCSIRLLGVHDETADFIAINRPVNHIEERLHSIVKKRN